MAGDDIQQDDRTEEATPERREEFRERGQVVVSRELTSILVLAAAVGAASLAFNAGYINMRALMIREMEALSSRRITEESVLPYANELWFATLTMIIPLFVVVFLVSSGSTLLQTRFNFSWKKVAPDFSKMNPLTGIARMVSGQAWFEALKGVAKMTVVGLVTYLILYGEWSKVPALMNFPIEGIFGYWGDITKNLFWGVIGLLLFVAAGDYLYNFITFERQIKMTKQEVKEEFKRREVDPHVKGRLRRMARNFAMRRTIEKTKEATVLITNPTHYSIALKYELGMPAPVLLAKGIDHIALEMREAARELKIPIIENRPLARELYATVKEGEELPDKFFATVAEIIRYVFQLKGKRIPKKRRTEPANAT